MKSKNKERWRIALPKEMARSAAHMAQELAYRLIKTENLSKSFEFSETQFSPVLPPIWQRSSLSSGFPGLAAMCFQFDACNPNRGWAECGYEFLELAIDGVTNETAQCHPATILSLFAGLSGLGLVLLWAPNGPLRYEKLLNTIDGLLTEAIEGVLSEINLSDGLPNDRYDVISGLAGVGRYLLARLPDVRARGNLTSILECLIHKAVEVHGVLQFFTERSDLDPSIKEQVQGRGAVNCGLAHGVPGPMALMSLCLQNGINLPGLSRAAEALADWLIAHSAEDEWGIYWPYQVVIPDESTPLEEKPVPSRAAWCYGNPGVARSLWLAGDALENGSKYREIAVSAMQSVYRRPHSVKGIESPSLCHGIAGLLQISARFASATKLPLFDEAVESLTRQLIAEFNPNAFWGYRDYNPHFGHRDDHGLLSGAIGVALSLLAVVCDVEPMWDQCLLLS